MNYKKVVAKSFNEALMQMRMQYGDDAIPISHKNVKEGGVFKSKFFGHDVVELTVAVPEKRGVPAKKSKGNFDALVGEKSDLFAKTVEAIAQKNSPVTEAAERKPEPEKLAARNPYQAKTDILADEPVSRVTPKNSDMLKFEKEFEEIKRSLQLLMEKQGGAVDNSEHLQRSIAPELQPFEELLQYNDYAEDDRRQILREMKNSMSPEDLKDRYKIEKSFKDIISSKIVTSGPLTNSKSRKKVIMFVGPTGVGKTTTIAKLGANFALREGKSVAFVTIDNYRIAATEQLKKYAEIMKIPIYAINDQKEFQSVIDKEKAEVILVDTSGRSHKNALKISEIKSYADLVECDFERLLCVSANTKKGDLENIFSSFSKLDFDSVIITKTDETSFIGNVINVADKYNKPISYYTNGQEVPNDILPAEPVRLAELVMGNQLEA